MKKFLVTGGAGFIGSHLVEMLLSDGHQVAVLDNFSYGKRHFLPLQHPSFSLYTGDLLEASFVHRVFSEFQPEIVYHLAAIHHIPTCERKPDVALRTNVEGSEIIFNAAKESGVGTMVFASSGAVYEIVDESLREDHTAAVPHDIYSISKTAGENLLRLHVERGHFRGVSCRLFNAVGARETNEHLVPDILKQVLAGSDRIQLGNLTPLRSYVHVKDIAEALQTIGHTVLEARYEVLNIGSQSEHSVADILELIAGICGRPLQAIQHRDRIRKVDRHRQRASLEKITRLTGWSPRRSLHEALKDAYAFAHDVQPN
jgi:UDP-glucose 4-epimerase